MTDEIEGPGGLRVRVVIDPRMPPDTALVVPPGHPLAAEEEPMTDLPRGVWHHGTWVPISDTLLAQLRGKQSAAEIAQHWMALAALARWQSRVAGWHGWAVAHSAGLAEDVLTRHAPVSDDFGLHCAACHEVAARHGEDVAVWEIDWPCEEYRAAARHIDYPV